MNSTIKKFGLTAISLAAGVALALMPFAASAATLTTNSADVTSGGTVSVSGSCGIISGTNVSFSFVPAMSTATSVGSTTTTTSGAYNATLTIPTGLATGTGVLSATCAVDGSVAYSNLNVEAASMTTPTASTLMISNTNSTTGGTFTSNGTCGTGSGNTVTFSLIPAISGATSLGTTTTMADGAYSTVLTVPSGLATGSAILSETCSADGSVAYANMSISGPVMTTTTTTTVPVGGVAAGKNNTSMLIELGLALALLGGFGLVRLTTKQSHV